MIVSFSFRSLFSKKSKDPKAVSHNASGWRLFGKTAAREGDQSKDLCSTATMQQVGVLQTFFCFVSVRRLGNFTAKQKHDSTKKSLLTSSRVFLHKALWRQLRLQSAGVNSDLELSFRCWRKHPLRVGTDLRAASGSLRAATASCRLQAAQTKQFDLWWCLPLDEDEEALMSRCCRSSDICAAAVHPL